MAAIIDGFKKFANYVVEGIGGEGPFDVLNNEEDGYDDEYGYEEDGSAVRVTEPAYSPIVEKRNENKVVSHPHFNRGGNELVVVEPRSFEDSVTIVQHLKDGKIVMVNLHLLDKEQAQRTIDFVCGASKALNGNPKKVGEVFVFAPSNVTLSADAQPQQNKFNDSLWGTALQ